MTAQINDSCFFKRKRYSLNNASTREGLFFPWKIENNGYRFHAALKCKDIGLWSMSTACLRSYILSYSVIENNLLLTELNIPFSVENFLGASPEKEAYSPRYFYRKLNYPIDFSGTLLICSGLISELSIRGGHQSFWKYKEVKELVFDKGEMLNEIDLSNESNGVRALVEDKYDRNNDYINEKYHEEFYES